MKSQTQHTGRAGQSRAGPEEVGWGREVRDK